MNRGERADEFYTRWAFLYDFLARRTPGIARLRCQTVAALRPPESGTVVEMGCGPGPNLPYLRKEVGPSGSIVGIDIARGALRRAHRRIVRRRWGNVHILCADATRPPIDAVDAVFAMFVVGMFDSPGDVVDEWCDTIGPGGRIGLVHFAKSDRWHAGLSNAVLDLLIVASTPGSLRFRRSASSTLDRRVSEAHETLETRCIEHSSHTTWGGLIHVHVGTVGKH